jgi:Tfp pilus assembly protein PilV
MSRHCSLEMKGSSLLEVLIALALMAVTMLAAVASQLGALRGERNAAHKEQALFIAASVAEAMREPETAAHALTRWQARAASVLPHGEVSIAGQGDPVALAVVRWSARQGSAPFDSAVSRECPREIVPESVACVAMPFAR